MSPEEKKAFKAAFVSAVKYGAASEVEAFLALEFTAAQDAWTPLVSATIRNRAPIVQALLPFSDVEHRVLSTGNTVLMVAAAFGSEDPLRVLLPVADAKATNLAGQTAFMLAAKAGAVGCVDALLPVSDTKAVDNSGFTALMHAAVKNRAECLERLLLASDLEARETATHQTALDLARASEAWACVDILAAAKSPEQARAELSAAPSSAVLPRCQAIVERAGLLVEVASAQNQTSGAKNGDACAEEGKPLPSAVVDAGGLRRV